LPPPLPGTPVVVQLQIPPPLVRGSRVALLAPAGPLRDPSELERAVANTVELGWEPVPGAHVLDCVGYLAGSDSDRVADLNRAIRDPAVDGIWCVRGGYGVLRLLDAVDVDALRRRPKALIGFSDITALHAAAGRCAGVVSYHGPTARGSLSDFSRASLERAVTARGNPAGLAPDAEVLVAGAARGRLAGGNLALLASLAGTPYFPSLEGAILVLEDVNEPVYRIDRMLRHLRLAGALDRLAGLAFGAFTECGEEREGDTIPLARVLRETAERAGVPCLSGVPVGHLDAQWTLPLGAAAELDASARRLTIDYPVA
jgi:muramoyltetrapeptide carboxypeptidase